ncbi:MAG: hypothetical protein U0527_07245 [Candidatus Eisenbacteria bacterium]
MWPDLTLLDGFLGGGSISLYAKAQGLRVIGTDIAERAMVTGHALVANNRTRLRCEDILRIAAPTDAPPGRVERDYAPQVFTQPQARFIDRALAIADASADPTRAALLRLLVLRVAMAIHPMSQVRKGTIGRITTGEFENVTPSCLPRYIDSLRIMRPEALWKLAQLINAGVFEGRAEVRKVSVIEALPGIEAAAAYWDPPYINSMAYEGEYRVLDELLEGSAKPISPFTKKDGVEQLDLLFERGQHIPVWILSYGNVGVGLEDLVAKMARFGRATRALEIRYQHLPAVATEAKKEANRELLVIGWDESAVAALHASAPRKEVVHA